VISRLHKFVALLLLALWLPATQHCDLEAAGLIGNPADCHESIDCTNLHEKSHCDTDNCQPVENTAYKASLKVIQIAAPVALSCLCCLNEISAKTILIPLVSPERSTTPLELVPTWQFSVRAAPPARAPSLNA